MNQVKILAVGLTGLLLIVLSLEITVTHLFETIYAFGRNPAWAFGPRELAHCVGFAGCTLVGWAIIRSFSTRGGRRTSIIASLGGLACFPLLVTWPAWIPFEIDHGLRKFLCTIAIPFYFIGTVMLLQFVKDCPGIARHKPAALMSAGLMWSCSIFWEIGIQPLAAVYGGPPRGYIQWAQLLSDFIGIWTPTLVLIGTGSLENIVCRSAVRERSAV